MSELENKKWPHSLTRTQYIEDLERQLEEAREKLEGVEELCYDFYSAGLSAGHPMTTAQSAERELKELEKELDQLKEKGDEH